MKKVYRMLTLGFLVSLTGCVSAYMQTNVRREEKPEFTRILIVSNLTHTSSTYLPTFQTAFPTGYQVCTVSNGPLSFDNPEEAIRKQQQTCRSEVLLTIDFNQNYVSGSGKYIYSNDELFLEMTNLATGKPFWKAVVTTAGNNEVAPYIVVRQLVKDGIIDGALPSEKSYRSDY